MIRRLCNNDEAAVQTMLAGLRSDTMDALIAQRLIYFPPCKPADVMRFATKAELLAAIQAGKGPMLPKKTPLLRADLALDATPLHAASLLQMRQAGSVPVSEPEGALHLIGRGPDWLMVLCMQTSADTLQMLQRLPAEHGVARLVVVAPRPRALALWLAERGVEAQALSLREALTLGQDGRKSRVGT